MIVLFAKDSKYVTASNKMMFWLAIFANAICGVLLIVNKIEIGSKSEVFYPQLLILGIVMLLSAFCMILMLNGKRSGGFATIGYSVLLALGTVFLVIAYKNDELIGFAGLTILNLWPTLAALYGSKRYVQQDVNLKTSRLSKLLLGSLVLIFVLTLVFVLIGIFRG